MDYDYYTGKKNVESSGGVGEGIGVLLAGAIMLFVLLVKELLKARKLG
jgi:hypothetical protein